MHFLEMKDISERHMELSNPISAEKLLRVGQVTGLQPGQRVIDFGCGFGEMLRLWGEAFGIDGVGIDVRPNACRRAREKFAGLGWQERFEIVEGRGEEYAFAPGSFDAAACIGATFIWGGFQESIRAMRQAIRPGGSLAIGEVYWRSDLAPAAYARQQHFHTEAELLALAWAEGFDVTYLVRSSQDDWDIYEAGNWRGLTDWLAENPGHPEWAQVHQFLRDGQDEYFRYGREHLGWAVYLLRAAT